MSILNLILPIACIVIASLISALTLLEKVEEGKRLSKTDWVLLILVASGIICGTINLIDEYYNKSSTATETDAWEYASNTPIDSVFLRIRMDSAVQQDSFLKSVNSSALIFRMISGQYHVFEIRTSPLVNSPYESIKLVRQDGTPLQAELVPYTYYFGVTDKVYWASSRINWCNTNIPICGIDLNIPGRELGEGLKTLSDLQLCDEFSIVIRPTDDLTIQQFSSLGEPNSGLTTTIELELRSRLADINLNPLFCRRDILKLPQCKSNAYYQDYFIPGTELNAAIRKQVVEAVLAESDCPPNTQTLYMASVSLAGFEYFSPRVPSDNERIIGMQIMCQIGGLLPETAPTNNTIEFKGRSFRDFERATKR